jgi:recombination protein RecA
LFYADALGIDVEELLRAQPDSGEQALNIVDTLVRTGAVGLIVVDSVAALVPQAELEKNIGDSSMGRQAALMSQAMRMLAGPISKAESTVIFTNQIRMKIGVMFGNPETTSGGNALKFYASQRLDVRRIDIIKEGTGNDADKIGVRTRVKVIKNKVGPPYKEVQFNILFGKGIDKISELLDLAVSVDLIQKSGAWYYYKEEQIQGAANATAWLSSHPEKVEEIRTKLMEPKADVSDTPVLSV